AARKNRVRRVVYTSSVATMGFTSNGRPADESSPVSLDHMIGHYKRSKFMAEQLAMEAGRSGMDVVVVNPTTPVGEQDIKPTPTGRIIVDFLKKKFPAYVLALATGVVDEMVTGHIFGREPRATIDAVRMGRKKMFVSSGKAERELGWRVVEVDDALHRAVEWFQANGYA